jgi:hypothetical protein
MRDAKYWEVALMLTGATILMLVIEYFVGMTP